MEQKPISEAIKEFKKNEAKEFTVKNLLDFAKKNGAETSLPVQYSFEKESGNIALYNTNGPYVDFWPVGDGKKGTVTLEDLDDSREDGDIKNNFVLQGVGHIDKKSDKVGAGWPKPKVNTGVDLEVSGFKVSKGGHLTITFFHEK